MVPIKKIMRRLRAEYQDSVTVKSENNVLTLTGSLPNWESVVKAGQLCADKKSRWTVVNHITCGLSRPGPRLPELQDDALQNFACDVVVIGAGVVGCAIARELSRYEISVLLLEKEHDVALGASSRNDGMIHPGVDLHPWQKKQQYNLRGNAMYDALCKELQVPFARTGQILGFTHPAAPLILWALPRYWHKMGVPCRALSRKALLEAEPHLNPAITGGLKFPTAGSVCPYGLTIALAENAVQNKVRLSLDTAVLGMTIENGQILAVQTNRGEIHPKLVINAAGVFADEIAAMAKDEFYSIHPRKGTNAILDKKAAFRVKTIASLLGTASTKTTHSKGGGLVRTADDNLLVGPDAVETPDRENYDTTAKSIRQTFEKQKAALPELSQSDIITYFTGVRAATYEEDFVIEPGRATQNLIHAAGIQSPGLTAAPAIGKDVAAMAKAFFERTAPVAENKSFDGRRTAIPRAAKLPLDERTALIEQNLDYGVIVCRCEEVSRGEILAALRRPVPCDTVDGVKRRVRPGMGRCQGGFCGPQVAQMIAEEKKIPLCQVLKNGAGSFVTAGDTKGGGADENRL